MPEKDLSPQEMMEQSYQQAKTSYVIRERRYHLLQAAAILYAGGQHTVRPLPDDFTRDYMSNWHSAESAVTEAEALLAEIEKRERDEIHD